MSRRGFVALGAGVAALPLLPGVASAATGYRDQVSFRSVYRTRPPDPTAVVLGGPGFETHGDGVGDDTAAVQAAIDEASRRGIANKLGDILGGAHEFPNLKALVYFHRDGAEEDEHWRVDVPDGGPAQTAFTAMATDPCFSA